MSDKENRMFKDFVGKDVLDGISSHNFDSLKNIAFITPENQDYFTDMLRVGWLSGQLSSSGPMPNSGKIVTTSIAGGGATSGTIFQPAAGEVYQITGATTDAMGASRVELHLKDEDGNLVEIGAETAAATQFDPDGWNPVYIDNNVFLAYFISGLSSTTSFNVAFMRVR